MSVPKGHLRTEHKVVMDEGDLTVAIEPDGRWHATFKFIDDANRVALMQGDYVDGKFLTARHWGNFPPEAHRAMLRSGELLRLIGG